MYNLPQIKAQKSFNKTSFPLAKLYVSSQLCSHLHNQCVDSSFQQPNRVICLRDNDQLIGFINKIQMPCMVSAPKRLLVIVNSLIHRRYLWTNPQSQCQITPSLLHLNDSHFHYQRAEWTVPVSSSSFIPKNQSNETLFAFSMSRPWQLLLYAEDEKYLFF